MRLWLARMAVIPFESMMAGLAIYSGIAGLFHLVESSDVLSLALAGWLVTGFNLVYVVAGLLMLLGLATARRDVEAPGLILLGMSVIVRFIAVVLAVGFLPQVLGLLVLYAMVLAACVARVRMLAAREVLVRVRPTEDGIDGVT